MHSDLGQRPIEGRLRNWRDIVLRTPGDLPFVVILWFLLSLAAGSRLLGVEHDYHQYRDFYASLRQSLALSDYRYEPGFVALAWFSKTVCNLDFHSFLFFVTAVSLAIKISLLRECRGFWLLAVCYSLSLYLIHEMTQIRASLGIAFGYLGAHLLLREKFRAAVLCVAIGVSMHYSVMMFAILIGVPLVWDLTRARLPISALIVIAFCAVTASALILYFTSLNPLIDAYATQYEDQINLLSIRNLMIISFLALSVIQYRKSAPEVRAHVFFLMAGVALFFGASSIPPIAHRFLELTVFSMFLIAGRSSGTLRIAQQTLLLLLAVFLFVRQSDYSLLKSLA